MKLKYYHMSMMLKFNLKLFSQTFLLAKAQVYHVIAFGLSITLLKYWIGYIKLIRPQELDDLIDMILLQYIRISCMMPEE